MEDGREIDMIEKKNANEKERCEMKERCRGMACHDLILR